MVVVGGGSVGNRELLLHQPSFHLLRWLLLFFQDGVASGNNRDALMKDLMDEKWPSRTKPAHRETVNVKWWKVGIMLTQYAITVFSTPPACALCPPTHFPAHTLERLQVYNVYTHNGKYNAFEWNGKSSALLLYVRSTYECTTTATHWDKLAEQDTHTRPAPRKKVKMRFCGGFGPANIRQRKGRTKNALLSYKFKKCNITFLQPFFGWFPLIFLFYLIGVYVN